MPYREIPLRPSQCFHIYNHANGFENIFVKEENYEYFLKLYIKYINLIADTFAYCLMPNHFHVLVRFKPGKELWQAFRELRQDDFGNIKIRRDYILKSTYQGNTQQEKYLINQLSLRFGNFFNAYAQAFNKQQKRKGSLFVPNFKRKEVADQQYFINLIHYIHYNPVYHGFCAEPIDWPFSSFQSISSNKPTRLLRDEVLESFGGLHQYQKIHQSPPKLIPEW